MKTQFQPFTGEFQCIHCRQPVLTDPARSGVIHRNHCPYCLCSKHLDLYEAGDRLAPCKGKMRPVGLTIKRTNKKYGPDQGELMLIHLCVECRKVSINRIAADDDVEQVLETFNHSVTLEPEIRHLLGQSEIQVLNASHASLVAARLFGCAAPMPVN